MWVVFYRYNISHHCVVPLTSHTPSSFYHSIVAEIDKDLSSDKMSPATVFMRTWEGEERIEPHDGKHDKNDYFEHISFLSFFF